MAHPFGKRAVIAAMLMILLGCSARLSGSYRDAAGETMYEFRRDGRASVTVLGNTVSAEYTLSGDKVIIASPQGTVVLIRRREKLYGPMGLELSPFDPTTNAEDLNHVATIDLGTSE